MFDWIPTGCLSLIQIVLLILFVVSFLLVPAWAELLFDGMSDMKERCIGFLGFAVLFLSLFFMGRIDREQKVRRITHITDCIESGYTLYINGAEADVSHITLEDYSPSAITVHDDIREVHIAANK